MAAKLKVYRADVRIYGTLYVKARNRDQAERIAKQLKGSIIEVPECDGNIPFSGLQYENPELPMVSLSPAMTLDAIEEAMQIAGS